MIDFKLIPQSEFTRVLESGLPEDRKLALYADMCRANTLTEIKKAGSGHIGSSFSAMDIVVHLYLRIMNTFSVGVDNPNRDIYFSSKGHDVPGFYALLFALGILPAEKLMKLRRFGGLDGHPDTKIPGVEANSGSLGMGISKGRGMAWAKHYTGHPGQVYVLTGDGEWQEGQNFEALQSTVAQQIKNLTVILDHNKVQSDKPVAGIVDLGPLEEKFRSFGWYVARCDGHDHHALAAAFRTMAAITDRPKILIADTIKGRGVSFMEHPAALKDGGGYYRWHSGAPADDKFEAAHGELIARIENILKQAGLAKLNLTLVPPEVDHAPAPTLLGEPISVGATKPSMKATAEFVAEAYGKALLEIAKRRKDLVVLDADLSADCRVRQFELTYPDRFIECGIAEQDMVSMAGGLARQGLLPVVNSFASFLGSRANEQIYNNASEKTKIIYANHYAGMIPAGPGKSHQSIRDISLFGALPNCIILQPCNPEETKMIMEFAVEKAKDNCMIRLIIGPSPRTITLPADYQLTPGQGVALTEGDDTVLFAYGPVMMHEALTAAEILVGKGRRVRVINMPWLNRIDPIWLAGQLKGVAQVLVVEDHAPYGALADTLLSTMVKAGIPLPQRFEVAGVEGYPACGTPSEALRFHKLDGVSLANRFESQK